MTYPLPAEIGLLIMAALMELMIALTR